MSARELTITILGLVGTFCMPWPGGPEQERDAALRAVQAYSPPASRCVAALPRVVAVRTSEPRFAAPPELAQAGAPP